ncbi:hypothetical protein MRX96_043875 [Rhipicephalus microplus]
MARMIQTANTSVSEAVRTTVHDTVTDVVRAANAEAFETVDSRLTTTETIFSYMEATVNNSVAGLEALITAPDSSFAVFEQSIVRTPAITCKSVL